MKDYDHWDEFQDSAAPDTVSVLAFRAYGIMLVGTFSRNLSGICIDCLGIRWHERRSLSPAIPSMQFDSFAFEIEACLSKIKEAPPDTFFVIQLANRHITRSRYIPSGLCRHSNQKEDRVALDPSRLIRRKDLAKIKSNAMLYDANFGPLLVLPASEFSVAKQVRVAAPGFDGPVLGLGKSFASHSATKIAELEALERYCGLDNRSSDQGLAASYKDLGKKALHPSKIGLYSAAQYAIPNFPCRPFKEDEIISWKLLRDLNGNATYAPEEMIHFGLNLPGLPLILETTNGCSLGSTREEAIAFGALELIERDSILRAWYGQVAAKRLTASAVCLDGGLEIDWLKQRSYDVHSFEVSSLIGISVVLHFGMSRSKRNAQVITSSAADWSQTSAYHRGLQELCSQADWGSRLSEADRLQARSLAAHPGSLRAGSISDHMLLFAHVSSKKFLRPFLQAEPFGNNSPCTQVPTLNSLIESLARRELSILFADLTAPDLVPQDLVCVKTVIPGLTPIFYGSGMDRIPAGSSLSIDGLKPHPFS